MKLIIFTLLIIGLQHAMGSSVTYENLQSSGEIPAYCLAKIQAEASSEIKSRPRYRLQQSMTMSRGQMCVNLRDGANCSCTAIRRTSTYSDGYRFDVYCVNKGVATVTNCSRSFESADATARKANQPLEYGYDSFARRYGNPWRNYQNGMPPIFTSP